MKIYHIETQGEKESVIVNGNSIDAVKFYAKETGILIDDIDDVIEIPESEWDNYKFTREEDGMPEITYADFAKEVSLPCLFASTGF